MPTDTTASVSDRPEAKPEGQQVAALKQMREWYKDFRKKGLEGAKQFYYLAGYAGTGKTFIVQHFLKEEKLPEYDVTLMTFMARSALVLSKASGLPASTIHSQIYKLRTTIHGEQWVLDPDAPIRNTKLIILDECSMVGEKMFKDILSFKRPVLILGDPGQLLPVQDAPIFTQMQPDFFLEEIRRQALDNPIIRISMLARNGEPIPPGNYDGKVIKSNNLDVPVWLDTNIVLSFSNAARQRLNATYRDMLGFAQQSPFPVVGDRLICLKNKHGLGLANGTMGTCYTDTPAPDPTDYIVSLDFKFEDGRKLDTQNAIRHYFQPMHNQWGDVIQPPEFIRRQNLHFDYAYAITGHKALGSQFEKVLVIDDGSQRDYNRWMYTAITRAIDTLHILG